MSSSPFAPWTRRRVTKEIRALKRRGIRLNGTNMQGHSTLYGHARRLFGSLEAAVWASGIDFDKERVQVLWTRAGILEWIRREWKKGRDIRPGITKKVSAGVFNAAVREFGGWYPAIRAAKIRGFKEVRKWTPERVIAALKAHGPQARYADIFAKDSGLYSAQKRYFGSWKKAREAAGYFPSLPVWRPRWTPEVLLKTIRERAPAHPRLRTRVFADLGGFAKAAAAMFGSWPKAVRAAGFAYEGGPAKGPRKWTQEVILSSIRERAAAGKSLRSVDIDKERGSLCEVARKRFGTWQNAIRAAGLEPPSPVWSKERVIAVLVQHSRNGVSARTTAFLEKDNGLYGAARDYFGSWNAAILAAGLQVPARQWKWPKERVVAELVRRKKLGLPIPKALSSAAQHRFGGIKKALASAEARHKW